VLLGVSGQPGTITEDVVATMAANEGRPVIMPLSNPTDRAEATPANLMTWSKGRAIVATGSPFAPVTYAGVTREFSQSNNVYVFPGLGLGAVAVGTSAITDSMLQTASSSVSDGQSVLSVDQGVLPHLSRWRRSAPASPVRSAAAPAMRA